jgi:hypothetical protein
MHAANQWCKGIELEESNGFLLVDVCDAFPEFSQAAMACYGLLDMT